MPKSKSPPIKTRFDIFLGLAASDSDINGLNPAHVKLKKKTY